MIDITSSDSSGMGIYNTETERAANILSVQLGALEYSQELGIDLKYFLQEDLRFQNESFKAYLIQVLATRGINVANLVEVIEGLSSDYIFTVSADESSTSLIAR